MTDEARDGVTGGGEAQRAIEAGIAGHTCNEDLHSDPSR
jgi:hypothetical protein